MTNCDTGNTPKEWFLSKKRPKEGERVARGHFHERVGESPGRYEIFGTSGSPVVFSSDRSSYSDVDIHVTLCY